MRVSTAFVFQNALRGLRRNVVASERAERQLATGRRIQTISDDPAGALSVMRASSQLKDIEQYQRNGSLASVRLTTEETVLNRFGEVLERAETVARSAASLDASDPVRQAAITEVAALHEEIVSLANTRLGDEFIFGGTKSDVPPFKEDGSYVGGSVSQSAEIDSGVLVETGHTGDQVFGGALEETAALLDELRTGNQSSISEAAEALNASKEDASLAETEVGIRLRQIKDATEALARRAARTGDERDALLNADPTESAVEALAAQTALERAYTAVSRVLSTNIMDYLR